MVAVTGRTQHGVLVRLRGYNSANFQAALPRFWESGLLPALVGTGYHVARREDARHGAHAASPTYRMAFTLHLVQPAIRLQGLPLVRSMQTRVLLLRVVAVQATYQCTRRPLAEYNSVKSFSHHPLGIFRHMLNLVRERQEKGSACPTRAGRWPSPRQAGDRTT